MRHRAATAGAVIDKIVLYSLFQQLLRLTVQQLLTADAWNLP
jgi:hypothetical protein